jgi:uncharacterized protein (DUF4213/DUF364 family)
MLAELLTNLQDGKVVEVRIGLNWTAVVIEVAGAARCGLASTLFGGHDHHSEPNVPEAGQLEQIPGREMAGWLLSDSLIHRSLGTAALNALLPLPAQERKSINAEKVIARYGAGKKVALVGHFPFVDRLHSQVGELLVLEQDPGPGDLPASAAREIIPQADVVAITGMTLINHTLQGLLELCSSQAFVLVLGPSTPLHPVLFQYGVRMLSGAIVQEIEPVLKAVSQGANFRQLHQAGVQLVTIERDL